MTKEQKRKGKIVLIVLLCFALLFVGTVFSVNAHIKGSTAGRILTAAQAALLTDVDCIIVFGCYVESNGTPSEMLRDRLTKGVELYTLGAAPKLLMSGDHGTTDYNEVGTMKQFAVEAGVPSSDIFMDHAGFSTYETVYRAKAIFGAKKVLLVTQEYHLYRALYIAEKLGLEAYGVACDARTYGGEWAREGREILARVKDFVTALCQPQPTYLGEAIPVSGDGDLTND